VHIGIDTVALKGEGFKRLAEEGQWVNAGDPVLEIDLDFLQRQAKSVITPVIVTNADEFQVATIKRGKVRAGLDPAMIIVGDRSETKEVGRGGG
jgi:phosphotransferase system IIA component